MKRKINRNKTVTIPVAANQKLKAQNIPAGYMVVDLTDRLYLPSGLFQGAVIENQSPDLLLTMVCQAEHKVQITPGKQIQ